jgi:hypothetical protein
MKPLKRESHSGQLLDNSESLGFSLNFVDDRFNHIHKQIKSWDRILARNTLDFSKSYINAECELAVAFRVRPNGEQFHLVFTAIPDWGGIGHRPKPRSFEVEASTECNASHWNEEFMLVSVTYLVECPQGLTPSFVWLVGPKERIDFFRDIFTSPLKSSVELGSLSRKGEVGVERILTSRSDSDSVHGVIQSRAKVVNNIPAHFGKLGREFADHANFVNDVLGFLRVRLGELFVSVTLVENNCSLFEIGKVTLSPCQLASRTFERAGHPG